MMTLRAVKATIYFLRCNVGSWYNIVSNDYRQNQTKDPSLVNWHFLSFSVTNWEKNGSCKHVMRFWHGTFFFSPRMPSTVDTSHRGCQRYNITGIVLVMCHITASQQKVIHCCNFNTFAMPYSQHWGCCCNSHSSIRTGWRL